MLHDPDTRHVHLGLELGQRATFTLEEKIEQEAARRVGERLEHAVVVHTRAVYVTIWLPVKGAAHAGMAVLRSATADEAGGLRGT